MGPGPLAVASVAVDTQPAPVVDTGDDEKGEAGNEEEDTGALPAGFFDDPEQDARARGVEAPSQKMQRELEDGLKKFEREMAVQIEESEETRNELDEEKAEEVAAEEEDFQSSLRGRLAALRKRAAERDRVLQEAAAAATNSASEEMAVSNAEDGVDGVDSDSDVEFDWRAKDFG